MNLILFLLIGAIAGWIAGKLLRGGGFGLIGNLVVGIVGAVIGGHLFSYLGVSAGGGLIGSLVTAGIGALVLLFIVGLIKKAWAWPSVAAPGVGAGWRRLTAVGAGRWSIRSCPGDRTGGSGCLAAGSARRQWVG